MSDSRILRIDELLTARFSTVIEYEDTQKLVAAARLGTLPGPWFFGDTAKWFNSATSNRLAYLRERLADLDAKIEIARSERADSREQARERDTNVLILGGQRYKIEPTNEEPEP